MAIIEITKNQSGFGSDNRATIERLLGDEIPFLLNTSDKQRPTSLSADEDEITAVTRWPNDFFAFRIGYARVSTTDQDLEIQLSKFKSEGCQVIRSEKISGGSRQGRNGLETVIQFLRPGDELVVTRLDRLGRDTRDVLNLIH